ncbi:hypothetical protein SF06_04670 [Pseudomonas flexibilis]|nr:hypothetical protein SF06_04670 [Pseudomonas flexibilis]
MASEAANAGQFPHFGSPTSQGMSPRIAARGAATSRRQYLSRMDRFQHGRSGAHFRTKAGRDQSKIAQGWPRFFDCQVFSTKRPECCTNERMADDHDAHATRRLPL